MRIHRLAASFSILRTPLPSSERPLGRPMLRLCRQGRPQTAHKKPSASVEKQIEPDQTDCRLTAQSDDLKPTPYLSPTASQAKRDPRLADYDQEQLSGVRDSYHAVIATHAYIASEVSLYHTIHFSPT